MLSQLRRNTKIILWVVIVAFVGLMFFVWGMNLRRSGGVEAGVVGKIDGARITLEEYRNEVANQRAAYYQQKGTRRGSQSEQEIDQKAWDAIIQNHLLAREVDSQRLIATDDEVQLEMQANPPAFIRSQPIFQTDSAFDQSKYLAALSDPQYDFRPLETYVRATLPLEKLQDYVVAGVRVTDDESRLLVAMLDEKATLSYVRVNALTDVKDAGPEPSESDLSSFYSSHTDEFKIPESRNFKYVQFLKQPSTEDQQYARDRINEARDAVMAEVDNAAGDLAAIEKAFGEIATEYSDDELTGQRGGDLGWIKHGQLRADLDSVAFRLDVGKVSDVIRAENTYHLMIVLERRTTAGAEEVRLRDIISRIETSPSTIDGLRSEASDFAQLAAKSGMDKACAEKDLKAVDTPSLTEQQMTTFFRIPAETAGIIFKRQKHEITHAAEGAQTFIVMEVTDVIPEQTPPLDQIRDRVRQAYVLNAKKEKARAIVSGVAQIVARGKTLEQAAAALNLQVIKTEPFTRTANVPGIGKDNPVTAAAFSLVQGQTSGPIANGADFLVMRLDDLKEPDLKALGGSFGQIKLSLLSTKQQAFVNDWYTDLLARAKIQDNRTSEVGGKTGSKRAGSGNLYTGY